jgi:hypothetical protein
MSEDEKKPEPKPKSRFVAEPEDLKFVTREESDARVKRVREEMQAYRDKMRQKAEEQRKQEPEKNEGSGEN